MLSEVFWIAFIGTASGLCIKIASMAYKFKCTEWNCWGITKKRNVVIEEKENEFEIFNKQKSAKINDRV